MMVCKNCGCKITEKYKYCPKCGKDLRKDGSKKYKVLFFIMIALIVIILISGMLLLFNPFKSQSLEEALEKSLQVPEETKDIATIYKPAEITVLISERTTHKILEQKENSVLIEITVPDVAAVCEKMISEDLQTSDFNEAISEIESQIAEALVNEDFEFVTYTVEVEIDKTEDGYEIIENKEYANALCGGLILFYEELMEESEG